MRAATEPPITTCYLPVQAWRVKPPAQVKGIPVLQGVCLGIEWASLFHGAYQDSHLLNTRLHPGPGNTNLIAVNE